MAEKPQTDQASAPQIAVSVTPVDEMFVRIEQRSNVVLNTLAQAERDSTGAQKCVVVGIRTGVMRLRDDLCNDAVTLSRQRAQADAQRDEYVKAIRTERDAYRAMLANMGVPSDTIDRELIRIKEGKPTTIKALPAGKSKAGKR